MQVIRQDNLPSIEIDGEIAARIFDGEQYGANASAIIVDVAAGAPSRTIAIHTRKSS